MAIEVGPVTAAVFFLGAHLKLQWRGITGVVVLLRRGNWRSQPKGLRGLDVVRQCSPKEEALQEKNSRNVHRVFFEYLRIINYGCKG